MVNAELAYLLGMVTGKGTVIKGASQTDIIIEIPHRNLVIERMDTRLSVNASLNNIRDNLEPLIGTGIRSIQVENKTIIKFSKINEDFLIREINNHFQGLSSCKDFRIPREVINSSSDIKREFMIGLADVTAHMRSSNLAYGLNYNHRVYIEIPVNWFLVVDIANLLLDLGVSIQNINWSHPNMRDPKLEKYNKGNHFFWAKEHQIKIYAEEFEKIGFRVIHKMNALRSFADNNRGEWDSELRRKIRRSRSQAQKEKFQRMIGHIEIAHHKFYWETKMMDKVKPSHPMENSDKIPEQIRGMHFNSWKEICEALGYIRR